MQYIYKRLGIKIKTMTPYNHGSLKTEWHIRTISEITIKQLTGTGLMWAHYLQTCTYPYSSFASPALNRLSLFQLTYGRSLKILLEIETNPLEGTFGSFKEYYMLPRKRSVYFQKIVHIIGYYSWI